jgi:ABC-type multidrug transport system fused ATPase/permease subunit
MAVATLASMTVRLGIDTDAMREGAEKAKGVLGGLAKGVAGLGIGAPVAAAVATGVGGIAAAFVSAGAAAKAFQLAVGPQMQAVAEVATLAEEAEKAAAAGAEDAADKQKEYNDALKELPPSTRAMAKEFIGLKKDYKSWSDELSSSTMPVFTKGLQIARRLLPLLTPFVKEASKAFGEFVDEIDRGTKGKGLESFANSMAKVAGQNLKSFLVGLKNIAVGIGGVIKAFLPMSTTMSGGFEESTAAFAKWGQGLSESEGFAQFIDLARQGAATLSTLATTVLKLAVAFAPLIGVTAAVALHLAEFINSLPPGAVQALAYAILGAVVAFKTFKAASSAVETASDLMNSRLGQVARRWVTTAATAIKSGARIAASAVANAARTAAAWTGTALRAMARFAAQMIRTAAIAIAQFVRMAARAVIWAATMAAQWLIAMGPIGWIIGIVIALVALIIANWDKVKAYTAAAWNWAVAQIKTAVNGILAGIEWLSRIPGKIAAWFGQAKDWAVRKALALVAWITGLPGRVNSALAGLLGVLRQRASTAFQALKDAAVKKALTLVSWARGLPGKIMSAIGNLNQLLVGAGRALIQGLIDGIAGMVGSLKSKLSSVTNMLPDWKGPMRVDLRLLAPSGAALMTGFMDGIAAQTPALRDQLQGITSDIPGMTADVTPAGVRRTASAARELTVKFIGSEDDFNQFMRRSVVVLGGGSVEKAYGQGR